MPSFAETLKSHGLELVREDTHTLQVNLGLLCNQSCRHCHLEAGPARQEMMDAATVDQVADYARRGGFTTVDITGGAPELNPELPRLIELVRPLVPQVMLRANLTALGQPEHRDLARFLAEQGVVIVASLPALNAGQTDAQRGPGVFERCLETLQMLNRLGYGQEGGGLELNLVSNPPGAFLPPDQAQAERRFQRELARKWGIGFNRLFTFANVPLGRFRRWLEDSGNYQSYLDKLVASFNPCAAAQVMCRSLVSVAWDGYLYDCDFNLAASLPLAGRRLHVSRMDGPPPAGWPIALGEHCFTCTAGSGFT